MVTDPESFAHATTTLSVATLATLITVVIQLAFLIYVRHRFEGSAGNPENPTYKYVTYIDKKSNRGLPDACFDLCTSQIWKVARNAKTSAIQICDVHR